MKNDNSNSILRQIPSESKIRTYLKEITFGKHLFCPRCKGRRIKKYNNRYHCKRCRKFFSITSSNYFKWTKLPLAISWLLLWCYTKKVPVDQTMEATDLSEVTVRRWFERFRANIPEDLDSRLDKNVQIDEFYRGGKRNGYSIVGAKQKGTKKVKFKVIGQPSVNRMHAIEFLSQNVRPNSNLYSDGNLIYRTIGKWWPVNHKYEIHKKFQFELTSEIEGLWGNFITFIRRMYHHVTKSKIKEYVMEFAARFSHKDWFDSPLEFLKISIRPVSC